MTILKKILVEHVMREFGKDDENAPASILMVAEMIDEAVMDIEIEVQEQLEKIAVNAVRKVLAGEKL